MHRYLGILKISLLFLYFPESNERLQVHLKERMHSLEEKNHLSNDLERAKKKAEEATEAKARSDRHLETLKSELSKLILINRLVYVCLICLCFFLLFRRNCQNNYKKHNLKLKTFEDKCFSKK